MSVKVKIPEIGESITEVTLGSWMVENGDEVEEGDILCEIESDKATVELPADSSGVIEIQSEEGSDHKIGDVIAVISPGDGKPKKKEEPNKEDSQEEDDDESDGENQSDDSSSEKNASPAARKILAENSIELSSVKGTGKDGRITKEDALNAAENKSAPKDNKKETAKGEVKDSKEKSQAEEATSSYFSRNKKSEKMTRLRKTISKRLVEAKNTTAMLTTFNEVDMSAVMELRKKYKDRFKEKFDVNLGFMSFFAKACAYALKEVPGVNAQIDGENIIYHDYVDIGVAVSTPKGLVVPVVRNVESLSLAQIEKEIVRLATKARDGKISIDEMEGGTFTITNGGIFGSMLSTPIINLPQSAILGMHNIVERPVAIDGKVEIRPIMYLALSYDHRLVDGKESVTYLYKVKEMLEDPTRLLLEV